MMSINIKLKKIFIRIKILLMQIFSVSIFDNHYVIYILGILIRKRIKTKELNINLNGYGLNTEYRNVKIIASLTSFPERINAVIKTIQTLLNQTVKPDELILWLADSQFPQKENELPRKLLDLKQYGLTIKWCEDLRSYKKIIPTLKEYPNDMIITFVDDIYYDNNVIEALYKEYLKENSSIQANRFCRLKIKNNIFNKFPNAYEYWGDFNEPSYLNMLIGYGGVLYPPCSLNQEVLNIEKFKEILPTQDDVWLWAMAVLNHTKINVVLGYNMNIRTVENTQQYGLCKINRKGKSGKTGIYGINQIIKEYPKILAIVKGENDV